ncbi:hypothetical protein D3C87_839200 [compost metagenome]
MTVDEQIINAINNHQRMVILYKDANDDVAVERTFDAWTYGEALLATGTKQPMIGGKFVGEHVARIKFDRIESVKAVLTESAEAPIASTPGSKKGWTWETVYASW